MQTKYLYVSPDKGKTIYKEYKDGTKVKISNKEFESEIFKNHSVYVCRK